MLRCLPATKARTISRALEGTRCDYSEFGVGCGRVVSARERNEWSCFDASLVPTGGRRMTVRLQRPRKPQRLRRRRAWTRLEQVRKRLQLLEGEEEAQGAGAGDPEKKLGESGFKGRAMVPT